MDTHIYRMLAIDSDPFRDGNDCCLIKHINTGEYSKYPLSYCPLIEKCIV